MDLISNTLDKITNVQQVYIYHGKGHTEVILQDIQFKWSMDMLLVLFKINGWDIPIFHSQFIFSSSYALSVYDVYTIYKGHT